MRAVENHCYRQRRRRIRLPIVLSPLSPPFASLLNRPASKAPYQFCGFIGLNNFRINPSEDQMVKLFTATAGLLLGFALPSPTLAQTVEKKSLTLDGARKVIAAAIAEARSKNAPGAAIAVVDDGGNLVVLERLDNTFAAGANISIGKARTAVLFKRPTKFFEDIINKGRTAMATLNDFTPLQGGVPIMVDGQIVGAVGVSGAASAQQDEELAIAGANALAARAAQAQ